MTVVRMVPNVPVVRVVETSRLASEFIDEAAVQAKTRHCGNIRRRENLPNSGLLRQLLQLRSAHKRSPAFSRSRASDFNSTLVPQLDLPAFAVLPLNELVEFRQVGALQILRIPFNAFTFTGTNGQVSDQNRFS